MNNVVLAGMPGSGKTTVARAFERAGRTVVDTDAEIVKRYGAIAEIFDKFGEEYFRDIESLIVAEVSALENTVISTGGGCLLRESNVNALKEGGKIVYLKALPETLVKRVEGNRDRPLLYGDTRARIEKLYSERTPVYEWAADFIVETDSLTPERIVEKITEYLG